MVIELTTEELESLVSALRHGAGHAEYVADKHPFQPRGRDARIDSERMQHAADRLSKHLRKALSCSS
jgi:hypothetical protein